MVDIATLDFETLPICKRPDYPPKPVGVAINAPGIRSRYMAWGHPTDNNCRKSDAIRLLKDLYRQYPVLMHNGKFDLEVGERHMSLPLVPSKGWHDSMLLAFLYNPRVWSLKLKDLAKDWLGIEASEQNKLNDWIITNIQGAKRKKNLGEYIYLAPGGLAGRYAKADIKMTKALMKLCYNYVKKNGMLAQYEIEKRCVIKVIEMERAGISIDHKLLSPDLAKAKKVRAKHERAIKKKLGDVNLNSGPQKVKAFEDNDLVKKWNYTSKGNPKTGIEDLLEVCTDKLLVKHLDYFSKYTKIIGTYMQPWLDSALENHGKFFPWFNTVRGENDKGAYTGRLSSNFQQVPRAPKKAYKALPFLRNYVVPDSKNHCLYNRDFASQEIRILAHFEDGALLSAYLANPELDVHDHVRIIMTEMTGVEYDRNDHVKPCNFLVVYGGGAPALSTNIKCDLNEARDILSAHSAALPGVKDLKNELNRMARKGEQFTTAGGRIYDFEPGREYVALNTICQGSAGDHTKRSLLNIDDMLIEKHPDTRIMLTVHDEFMLSGPKKGRKIIMKNFKEAMEYDELFDLSMLTDGKIGDRWGDMESVG